MEIMYSSNNSNYFLNNNFIGFFGEISDLSIILDDINEPRIKKNSKVRKYIKYNKKIFDLYNLDKDFLNKNIDKMGYSEYKIFLMLLASQSKAKIVILNYYDLGFNHKQKNTISKIIKYINAEQDKNFIILSNDMTFLNKCVKHIIISKNGIIKYQGKLLEAIESGYLDKPSIIDFIDKANEKGANLSYTLDGKELLKDIYRSVF